ncbi:MAG: hypothetical protein ABH811_00410 [archaeon]
MGDVSERINRNNHFNKARELFYSSSYLRGKFLLGLMDGEGKEVKIICSRGYQNLLHEKNATLERGVICESLGVEIKENPFN